MAIEELKISNNNQDEEFDYKKIHDKCLVDLSEELMLPPTALSIGTHEIQ